MEKIRLEKRYEKDGRYIMGYAVEPEKPNRSAIIIVAGYTQEEAERKLALALKEMPEKFARKYYSE